jgi:hypothetical protein
LTPVLFAKSDRLRTIKSRLGEIEKALQPDQDKRETSKTAAVTPGDDAEKVSAAAADVTASNVAREGRREDKIARLRSEYEDTNKRTAGRCR